MTADPRPPKEGDLLARARQGDHGAFIELAAQHDPRLRGLADRLLHERPAVDDVLQRSYVTAYAKVGQARASRDVGKWLFRITYNCCVDALRARNQLDTRSGTEPDGDVRTALAGLPVAQRVAIVLVDGEGFSEPDVAEILGVDPDKIAMRLRRARSIVHKALPDQSDPDTAETAVRDAIGQLPIPDHDPQFWAMLEALLAPAPAPVPAPTEPAEPTERTAPVTARHLAIGTKTALVPTSLRRASNALLLALAVAAAVIVIVSGLTLVRNRSEGGMGPREAIDQSVPVVVASVVIPVV